MLLLFLVFFACFLRFLRFLRANIVFSFFSFPEPEEKAKIAKQCILHSLRDKQTYLYDSLLSNPIMEHVKNTPDYELLEIFTKGMLSDYRRFTQSSHGQTFLSEIHRNAGVDPSPFLERKIRQLTRRWKKYMFCHQTQFSRIHNFSPMCPQLHRISCPVPRKQTKRKSQ